MLQVMRSKKLNYLSTSRVNIFLRNVTILRPRLSVSVRTGPEKLVVFVVLSLVVSRVVWVSFTNNLLTHKGDFSDILDTRKE